MNLVTEYQKEHSSVTMDQLAQAGAGLFPVDLLDAARSVGMKIKMTGPLREAADPIPHPSPATAEWFFTRSTASSLARMLPGRTLCLGTPSIAAAKSELNEAATLVDVSPWVGERFGLSTSELVHHVEAAVEAVDLEPGYDSAIIDPPWYFPSLTYWLELASSLVVAGGRILVPLLGGLTRPKASFDREKLLAMASGLGSYTVTVGTVLYETPRFERLALERAGVFLSEPWRRSDLLEITNESPAPEPSASRPLPSDWTTIRFHDSLIAVRKNKNDYAGQPPVKLELTGLGPDGSFLLDSVSRRDQRIAKANVWTSENTGAKCSNVDELQNLFEKDFTTMSQNEKSLFNSIVSCLELPF